MRIYEKNNFFILSIFVISNVGFSEIQEAYGMIFDERIIKLVKHQEHMY